MDSKPGPDPESAQSRKQSRSVLAENAKAVSLLLAVPWIPTASYGGWLGCIFFFFLPKFYSHSQLSQGTTPEALGYRRPPNHSSSQRRC